MSRSMSLSALEQSVAFVKAWLPARFASAELPGMAVAVSHRGSLLLNEAYGWADVEHAVPLTPAHQFRVASHSKTFTATAVMLLVEEGRLRLDDPVAQHVPWLLGHRDRRWQHVTLRQLLSHGAGVIRDGRDTDYWQLERAFPDRERFQAEMEDTDLVVENNTRLKYSNYGYTLLGLVIEAVAGQPYNQFVMERIVQPLGLLDTAPDYGPGMNLATGYTRRESQRRQPLPHVSTHAMSPATGFCSTAADLACYFTAHMVGSGELLSDESKKEMQRTAWTAKTPGTPERTDYGLGMVLQPTEERRLFGHSGGFPGFVTLSAADPDSGLVVVALTNADGPAASMVTGIYSAITYFQKHASAAPPTQDARRWAGHYANLWGEVLLAAVGDGMVAANPGSWDPLAAPQVLEFVDGDTLRIVETSGFGSEGELVRWEAGDGRMPTLRYAGSTLWPIGAWRERTRPSQGASGVSRPPDGDR